MLWLVKIWRVFKRKIYTASWNLLTLTAEADRVLCHIAQNEWTSVIIHERRSSKFECTSALNKLRIREEWAIFGPPALIKLLGATLLAPKWQNHGRNIKNEWLIYGLSTKNINFTLQKDYPSALENCWKDAIFCMEADFGRVFLETSNKILKTTDRICKIALSLNRIRFNF